MLTRWARLVVCVRQMCGRARVCGMREYDVNVLVSMGEE